MAHQRGTTFAESEFSLEALIELFPDIVLLISVPDGRILGFNSPALEAYGYSREELLSLTVVDLRASDARESLAEHLRAADTTGAHFQTTHRRKDASSFPVEVNARATNFNGVRVLLSVVRDISDRLRVEAELRESVIKVSIDRAPHAAYWFDPDGRFVYVNEAGCRCLGYSRDEILSMSVQDVNPNATQARWHHAFQSLKQGRPLTMESVHRRKDGRLLDVEVTSSYFQLDGREYCLGFAVDISERLRAQREHSALQAQLNHAQKMESVGRFAGGVAHDFNNMLTIIQMSTQQALEQLEPNHPIREDLLDIDNATKRSADLTRQLLAFARKQPIAPETLDLNATVQGMLSMLRRLLGENLELKWQPSADLWQVLMDPSQLDQLLANLCVNSRDAIGDVGTVSIATVNRTFDDDFLAKVPGTPSGDYVELRVSDNGCGMDAETQAHLFEPFFTTKGEGKGTGLGLATVYGIVKQNGGFIVLRSERGQGTTIAVCLPRHVGAIAETRAQATWPRLRQGRQTVLVVEDESTILRLIARTLAKLGYTVLLAPTPVRAVDIAREHAGAIHLLLTDVVMPQMNGRELAQQIKATRPQVKCLFMSGYTSDVIAHHGVRDEGLCFISKPFTAQLLAAKVQEALDELPS